MFVKSLAQLKNTYPPYILILSIGAFLLPFIYIDSLIHKSTLTKYIFIAFISTSSFTTWLISTLRPKTNLFYYNSLFSLLVFIFIFAALSILWSQFKGSYQFEIIHFACLLLLSFVSMQIKNIRSVQLLLFSAVIGGAITSFLAFLQTWGWNPFEYNSQGVSAASFINKNYLANYVDLLIPTSLFLLATLKSNHKKWIISISISFLFSYLIFSHNRASWLSLLVTFSLILYFSYKHSWLHKQLHTIDSKYIFFITFLSIILINSPSKTINEADRFASLYNSIERAEVTSSTTLRLGAYRSALEIIKDNPIFGTGLGSFQIAFKPYNQNIIKKGQENTTYIQLHNDPLQVFVELGVIGGGLVITFVVMLFYFGFQKINLNVSSNERTEHSILILGMLLAVTASMTHSFLDFPLHLPASSFLLFIFVSFLLHSKEKTRKLNLKVKVFFFILVISISVVSINFYTAFYSSSYYLNNAIKTLFSYDPIYKYRPITSLKNEKNCKAAKLNTDKALELYSNDFHLQAWAYVIYVECVKDQKEYLKLSQKILADNPYSRPALESSASISFNKKDYSSAKRFYQILNHLYPLDAGYTLLLGHIAVKQKDYTVAHNFYKKTLILQPQNAVAPDMINKLISKGYIKVEVPTK